VWLERRRARDSSPVRFPSAESLSRFRLRSPLKRNHARSALTGDSSSPALYPAAIYTGGTLSIITINGASATPEFYSIFIFHFAPNLYYNPPHVR